MIHDAKYLIPPLFSFVASIFAIYFLLWTRGKSARRLGGLVVILVFAGVALLNKDIVITKPITGILVGGLVILLFGLWDDLKNINWKWQLIAQIIIAITAISFGVRSEYISNPFGGVINLDNPTIYIILYTLYFLLFINSLNWLDGIDGLSGGVTLASLGVVFFLSLKPEVNQPATAILSAIAGGAILGFLVFNWHPAKIIAGTSGAWFFGFILASLSIFAGAKIATVLMAALIPVLDLTSVIWERYQAGQSIFQGGDSRHLHHKLIKLGLGEKQTVILVAATSILIGFVALNISAIGKAIFIVLFSVFYFGLMRKIRIIKSIGEIGS
ncbi:MAG: MraY family glycosyltransferase [Patescibacteria group bacterium]|nr:MraY family glycosyltransferase [Patescibacteria group bacterium]